MGEDVFQLIREVLLTPPTPALLPQAVAEEITIGILGAARVEVPVPIVAVAAPHQPTHAKA